MPGAGWRSRNPLTTTYSNEAMADVTADERRQRLAAAAECRQQADTEELDAQVAALADEDTLSQTLSEMVVAQASSDISSVTSSHVTVETIDPLVDPLAGFDDGAETLDAHQDGMIPRHFDFDAASRRAQVFMHKMHNGTTGYHDLGAATQFNDTHHPGLFGVAMYVEVLKEWVVFDGLHRLLDLDDPDHEFLVYHVPISIGHFQTCEEMETHRFNLKRGRSLQVHYLVCAAFLNLNKAEMDAGRKQALARKGDSKWDGAQWAFDKYKEAASYSGGDPLKMSKGDFEASLKFLNRLEKTPVEEWPEEQKQGFKDMVTGGKKPRPTWETYFTPKKPKAPSSTPKPKKRPTRPGPPLDGPVMMLYKGGKVVEGSVKRISREAYDSQQEAEWEAHVNDGSWVG